MIPKHTVCVFVKGAMGTYLPFHTGTFVSRFQQYIKSTRLRRSTHSLVWRGER